MSSRRGRAAKYIRAGDIFPVVLSQRMSIPFRARPVDVYRALRALDPSPYMYFIDLGGTQIVGSSPEILVRLEAGRITLRPIAVRARAAPQWTKIRRLKPNCWPTQRTRLEHLMLIDLERNDVGRVAHRSSVSVPDRFVVERYSHVMHIVSQVEGELADGPVRRCSARHVPGRHGQRRARFAPSRSSGTGTGQTQHLFRCRWLSGLARRCGHRHRHHLPSFQDGRLHVQAGAGIVFDSDPELECMPSPQQEARPGLAPWPARQAAL